VRSVSSEAPPYRYDPDRCALVVVDVQNDFCHPDGSAATGGADLTDVTAMIPRLEALLAAARAGGVPVVFVRTEHDAGNDSFAWVNRRLEEPRSTVPQRTTRTGSWGAELFRVAPEPGEPVVTKHRYSAFAGTSLDLTLRSLGVTSLLVCGVATEVCVESTIRDGLFAEYLVAAVGDCCATYDADAHAASLRAIAHHFGIVTTSEHVAAHWRPRRTG
jgi:nicotinamidase-related amidase